MVYPDPNSPGTSNFDDDHQHQIMHNDLHVYQYQSPRQAADNSNNIFPINSSNTTLTSNLMKPKLRYSHRDHALAQSVEISSGTEQLNKDHSSGHIFGGGPNIYDNAKY